MKLLLLLLLLALTACGVRPTAPIPGGPAPIEEVTEGRVLYLLRGATLTRVVRPPERTPSLDLLAAGPTSLELAEGLTTEIPPYAAPITAVQGEDGITVRISAALKYLSPQARSQLVCTAIPPGESLATPVTLTDPTEKLLPLTCPFDA
ncbi:MAG: hypothetical protein WBA97_33805 [Actinophytocola sp.]|uniref:hypothetical protein n=1 Tax=Actinophytocola sp. TaxID=1872138 RepID=UPI003C722BF2